MDVMPHSDSPRQLGRDLHGTLVTIGRVPALGDVPRPDHRELHAEATREFAATPREFRAGC
jgi:hypothetical protein